MITPISDDRARDIQLRLSVPARLAGRFRGEGARAGVHHRPARIVTAPQARQSRAIGHYSSFRWTCAESAVEERRSARTSEACLRRHRDNVSHHTDSQIAGGATAPRFGDDRWDGVAMANGRTVCPASLENRARDHVRVRRAAVRDLPLPKPSIGSGAAVDFVRLNCVVMIVHRHREARRPDHPRARRRPG